MNPIDLSGRKFGKIKIESCEGPSKRGRVWVGRCECGRFRIETASRWLSGKPVACIDCMSPRTTGAPPPAVPGAIWVPLTLGYFCLIDEADALLISCFSWRANDYGALKYAVTTKPGTRYHTVGMHRIIARAPAGTTVDHINGNGLDNRRSNLRLSTHSQNAANRHRTSSVSGFKGVTKTARGGFQARIAIGGGRSRNLGTYDAAETAALAYDLAAIAQWGAFAKTNLSLNVDMLALVRK